MGGRPYPQDELLTMPDELQARDGQLLSFTGQLVTDASCCCRIRFSRCPGFGFGDSLFFDVVDIPAADFVRLNYVCYQRDGYASNAATSPTPAGYGEFASCDACAAYRIRYRRCPEGGTTYSAYLYFHPDDDPVSETILVGGICYYRDAENILATETSPIPTIAEEFEDCDGCGPVPTVCPGTPTTVTVAWPEYTSPTAAYCGGGSPVWWDGVFVYDTDCIWRATDDLCKAIAADAGARVAGLGEDTKIWLDVVGGVGTWRMRVTSYLGPGPVSLHRVLGNLQRLRDHRAR